MIFVPGAFNMRQVWEVVWSDGEEFWKPGKSCTSAISCSSVMYVKMKLKIVFESCTIGSISCLLSLWLCPIETTFPNSLHALLWAVSQRSESSSLIDSLCATALLFQGLKLSFVLFNLCFVNQCHKTLRALWGAPSYQWLAHPLLPVTSPGIQDSRCHVISPLRSSWCPTVHVICWSEVIARREWGNNEASPWLLAFKKGKVGKLQHWSCKIWLKWV